MKPKDLIRRTLQEKVEPALAELGFVFSQSSVGFKRICGDFKHEINTHLNRYNEEDIFAEFYFSFAVSSKNYSKWHLSEYGEKNANSCLASEMCWNLLDWKCPKLDLTKQENLPKVTKELLVDTLTIGLPFLEKYSNWEKAALRYVEKNTSHARACDFYLIAGNKEKAYWALKKALETWEKYPQRTFFIGEKEDIANRFFKYFGEQIELSN